MARESRQKQMEETPVMTEAVETPTTENNEPKRPRTLTKEVTDTGVKIAVVGGSGEKTFNVADLPEGVQQKLMPFGLSHKLGDAAAGKKGTEAEEAIQKTWEALMKGDWSFRAPASPKISLKDVADKFAGLSEAEQAAAKALFEQLGFKVPGVTA